MPWLFGSLGLSTPGADRLHARFLKIEDRTKILTRERRYNQVHSGMRMLSMKQDVRLWL